MRPTAPLARLRGALSAAALSLTPALAQLDVEPGFVASDRLDLAGDRAYGTLADGSFVSFDGLAFELYASDGQLLATLGGVPSFVFPSFVAVHPSQAFAVAGESSLGDLFRVDLAGGGVTTIANLPFNFDLAWDVDPGLAWVSAALGGFGAGNDVLRLDLASLQVTATAHVDGPSGPLAVDADGDLLYVTVADGFPPPAGSSSVIRWSDAQLDSGALLSEADAALVYAGLEGASSLLVDHPSGRVLVAHTNFVGLPNEVLQLSADGLRLDVLATASTHLSNLELFAGVGPAVLAAYQPTGARLYVQDTDFAGPLRDRVRVEPLRPQALFSGPPAGQSGAATVTIVGAEPNGSVNVLVARSADVLPSELVHDFGWAGPFFTAVRLPRVLRRTAPLPVDATGSASWSFSQPAAAQGALLFQALVADVTGEPLGSSTAVVND